MTDERIGWALLHGKLPPAALKPLSQAVYGIAGLTDVNEAYLIQRLFASGFLWSWKITSQAYLGSEERSGRTYYLASVSGELLIDDRTFAGSGAHDNKKVDAAYKGAATVAFKNACKLAGLTIELFKDGRAMDFLYEDRDGKPVDSGAAGSSGVQPASAPASSSSAGTAPASPPPSSQAPSPAPVTEGELGQIEELYKLAETLEPKRTRPEVDGRVTEVGFEAARKQLITRHKMEHGSNCPHIPRTGVAV